VHHRGGENLGQGDLGDGVGRCGREVDVVSDGVCQRGQDGGGVESWGSIHWLVAGHGGMRFALKVDTRKDDPKLSRGPASTGSAAS
jgi:hypothetical protein